MGAQQIEMIRARLRALMKSAGIGAKPLAKAAGLGETAVRDLLEGHSQNPRIGTLRALADYFGVPLEHLLGEDLVVVVGYVGAGGEVVFVDDHEKGAGLYTVPPLPGQASGMIGLEVRGQSMWPLYRDGTVLFIRRETEGLDEGALGDLAVVRLADGRTLVKELRSSATPGRFDLMSLNAPPIEAVELLWATPVRGALTRAGRAR